MNPLVIWDLNDDYAESSRPVVVRPYEGGPEFPVPLWLRLDDEDDERDEAESRWTWGYDEGASW